MKRISTIYVACLLFAGFLNYAQATDETTVRLVITGGHVTDPRDHGRPVILIGHALGVPPAVFREAFSHVLPAPAGEQPKPDQVRRNKAALMKALAHYDVTNERLDEVSNYYRYRPESGRLWPTKSAIAFATIKDGKVTSVRIQDAGSGYCSLPTVSVPGYSKIRLKATLAFGRDIKVNGSIAAITVPVQK